MDLKIFDSVPDGFLDLAPNELRQILPGPSLIHCRGKKRSPLFLATLLHGNETTGIRAIQKLLKKRRAENRVLERDAVIFVGNVEAAKNNVRRFSKQPDYNRIWNGGNLPEHRLAAQVLAYFKAARAFASIDIHNTSGKNPHYSCINRLEAPFINLARLFSQTLVYFTRPKGVLSMALAEYCPSVTIESGQPGDPYGEQHVYEFLEKCLGLKAIPGKVEAKDDLYVYHTIVRIQVPKEARLGFDENFEGKDFSFVPNLDARNFTELPEGSLIGWRFNPELNLAVMDESDRDVESDFIEYRGREIRLKRPVVPSMFSLDEQIVHQDCLGYLMERYNLPD